MCFGIAVDFLSYSGTKIGQFFNIKLPSYWYNIFDHFIFHYKKISLIKIHKGMLQK